MLKHALVQLNKQLGGRTKDTFVSYHALEWILCELCEPMEDKFNSQAADGYCKCQMQRNIQNGYCGICRFLIRPGTPIEVDDSSKEKLYNVGVKAGFEVGQRKLKDQLQEAWYKAKGSSTPWEGFIIFQNVIREILKEELKDG